MENYGLPNNLHVDATSQSGGKHMGAEIKNKIIGKSRKSAKLCIILRLWSRLTYSHLAIRLDISNRFLAANALWVDFKNIEDFSCNEVNE